MATLATHPDYSLYSNAFGFMRLPLNFDPLNSDADVVITGVPFDIATTGRSGARLGPEAMRKASVNLAWQDCCWPWDFKLRERLNIVDCGDLVFECGTSDSMINNLTLHADQLIGAGKTLLTFGGDHFITLPLLRAHAKHYGKMALIHFDAHTDTYNAGGKYDHGTMFYHAPNEGLIDRDHSIQIGIRTEYTRADHGFEVLEADRANDMSADEIINTIRQRVGDLPIYLSFDIDCLDPAHAPGTGTPVCGGLTSDKALKIIRGLQGLNIVGMDVVEVAPAYDHADLTALAAANLASEMLHLQALRLKP